MPAAYPLQIVTPEGPSFDGSVQSLRLPGIDGQFGVLARHAPMIAGVQSGMLDMVLENGQHEVMAIGDGFFEVSGGKATVLTDFTNAAGEIDVSRAEAARDRARKRLEDRANPEIDVARAEAALQRALMRIKVAAIR